MRIETAMNHNQNDGLLKMIRRTDPMILHWAHFFSFLRLLSRTCVYVRNKFLENCVKCAQCAPVIICFWLGIDGPEPLASLDLIGSVGHYTEAAVPI